MTKTETGNQSHAQNAGESRTKPYEKANQRGIYRAYTPAEVIDGWREIVMSRGPSARSKPASLDRPGKRDIPNVAYLQWLHVETGFFPTVIPRHLARLRAEMLSGDSLEACAVFSDWSKQHPFRVVPNADETGAREMPEQEYRPLRVLCEIRGVDKTVAYKAAKPDGPLKTIKPKGSPIMTTLAAFDEWRERVA